VTTVLVVALAGVLGSAAAAAVWVRRHWVVVTVRGSSMLPALCGGDVLLVRRCGPAELEVGDVVVVESPPLDPRATEVGWSEVGQWLVKRLAAIPGDRLPVAVPGQSAPTVPSGTLIVLGDNGGYDSRVFGPLPTACLRGVVVRRMVTRCPT
jgi:signal peptidase I